MRQQLPSTSHETQERKERRPEKNRWNERPRGAGREERRGATPRFFAVVKDGLSVDPRTPRKRKTRHSDNPPVEHHVGWIMDVREHRPRTYSTGYVTSPISFLATVGQCFDWFSLNLVDSRYLRFPFWINEKLNMMIVLFMSSFPDWMDFCDGKNFESLKIRHVRKASVFKFTSQHYWIALWLGHFRSSAGTSPNEGYLSSSYGSVPQALPTFQHPSHALLKENGFTQQVYHKYHSRCLKGIVHKFTHDALVNSDDRFGH